MASTPRSQAPDVSFPADASHHNKLKAEIMGFRSENTAKTPLKCSSLWPAAIRWVAFFVVCNDLKVWFFSCLHLGVITCSIFSSSTSDHGWVLWLQPFSVSGSSSRWAGVVPQSKLLTCKWTGLCSCSLSFRTSSQRIQATLCRTELLQGRDRKIPNLHPNVFKTLKVLRWNSLA